MRRVFIVLVITICFLDFTFPQNSNKDLYMIITTPQYLQSNTFSTFTKHRKQEFEVEIYLNDSIGNQPDDFRNFILEKEPSYVLLIGDYEDFPAKKIQYVNKTIESYNYYVSASTSGHPEPIIPLGLAFVKNEFEFSNFVNKTISTENKLNSMPLKYYAHAGSIEALWPWPVEFNEEILTEMHTRYFEPAGFDFSMSTALDSTPNDALTDINTINEGVSYIMYHGHGNINKWSFGMGVGGLSQLNNDTYPYIFSFSCLTGSFSGKIDTITAPCFGSRMVAAPYGAVAFFGAYNTSGRGQNPLMEGLCNGIFQDTIERIGDALIYAFNQKEIPQTVQKYHPYVSELERERSAYQFHLFGDPALKLVKGETSSIQKSIGVSDFSIYPNPTHGMLFFNHNMLSDYKIIIFDIFGKIILSADNINQIDISGFQNGTYILRIENEGEIFNKRIIKN